MLPVLLLIINVLVAGCTSTDDASQQADRKAGSPASGSNSRAIEFDAPYETCVNSVYQELKITEVAALIPDEYEPGASDGGNSWTPARLVDLAVLRNGYALVDQGNATIHVVSRDFRERSSWGRKGGGPGEFVQPHLAAYNAAADQLSVYDQEASRVTVFDGAGRLVRTYPVSHPSINSIAFDVDGSIVAAHSVMGRAIDRGPAPQPLVSSIRGERPNVTTVHQVTTDSMDATRFVLPGPNYARVATRGDITALFLPASGVVEIFQNGKKLARAQSCMPQGLRQAYDKQLTAVLGGGPRGQGSIQLISDVHIGDDDIIYTATPVRDARGRLHIDRFSLDGKDLGSIVAYPESIQLAELRFGHSPLELISMSYDGTVKKFVLRP